MAFVIERKQHAVDGLVTDWQLVNYARFLERKIVRLQRRLGVRRLPAAGFKIPDLDGRKMRLKS